MHLCGQKIPVSIRADDTQTLIPTEHHDLIRQWNIFYTHVPFPIPNTRKFPLNFLRRENKISKDPISQSVRVALNEWVVWNETHLWHKSDWSLNPGHACKELHWSERDGIGETLEILQWKCASVRQRHASFRTSPTSSRVTLFVFFCYAVSAASVNTHTHTPAVHHSCSVPSLVGNLGGGLLFQSVYDWLDAPLDAGRYAAGDGVARGRSRGAGLPQTLLIPQLEKTQEYTGMISCTCM